MTTNIERFDWNSTNKTVEAMKRFVNKWCPPGAKGFVTDLGDVIEVAVKEATTYMLEGENEHPTNEVTG